MPSRSPKRFMSVHERELAVDESSPLLGTPFPPITDAEHNQDDTTTPPPPSQTTWAILSVLSVLLVGVFVSNCDTTFLLAAYPQIASEFGALQQGAWLLTAYMLAMCAVQPLYGRLSSLFGRKPLLLIAYALYALGSAVCAVGGRLGVVVAGRVLAGMGGAGLVCLVSLLITDLVPLREVAAYRSYVNIVQTLGRSVGAPLGGLVADRWGWRSAFRAVVPLTLAGGALVAWRLEGHLGRAKTDETKEAESVRARLKRVDVVGAVLLATFIALGLAALSVSNGGAVGAESVDVSPSFFSRIMGIPLWFSLAFGSIQTAAAFFYWETKCAAEPVFPPQLLAHRAVWTSYLLLLLQNTAQAAATLSVPLFVQVTRGDDVGSSGLYLLPSVVGNTVGGLSTGVYVSRTGRYRGAAVVSGLLGFLGYGTMLWRWVAGPAFHPVADDMCIFFAGAATGTAHAAAFMALAAGLSAQPKETTVDEGSDVPPSEDDTVDDTKDDNVSVAIAGAGIYLSGNVGGVVGLSLSSALLQGVLTSRLQKFLDPSTIDKVLSSVDYVLSLPVDSDVRARIVDAYVNGFHATFWEAATCSALAFAVALCIREHVLK
ncbi:hypothetical protein SBRCBS47491_008254 [Sporothrix bragantina]|uniref:Major facilitator superfamily (MFS) profile domain-containing protein n=1 Tax=Sporothrix bragantina TaxID=671064 RepID=A0ABP0CJX5_9PEZI